MPADASSPSYSRPPLDEVAASMQFPGLPVKAVDIADFFTSVRKEYPKAMDVAPLPPMFEALGPGMWPPVEFNVGGPILPRSWFISDNDEHVIQFQPDRLIVNWRTRATGGAYPRYPEVKRRFIEAHRALAGFCQQKNFPAIVPNQCDLTYYNKVTLPEGATWGDFGVLLRGMRLNAGPGWKGEFSVGQLTLLRDLRDTEGSMFARLRVDCQPIQLDLASQAWAFNIAVKGRPIKPTFEGVLNFLDLAHTEIVSCFDAITSETLQAEWGKVE